MLFRDYIFFQQYYYFFILAENLGEASASSCLMLATRPTQALHNCLLALHYLSGSQLKKQKCWRDVRNPLMVVPVQISVKNERET